MSATKRQYFKEIENIEKKNKIIAVHVFLAITICKLSAVHFHAKNPKASVVPCCVLSIKSHIQQIFT